MPLAKALARARRKPLFVPEASHEVGLGRAEIERMLPHRDPLLLVDRIDAVDVEDRCLRAYRRIDPADPVLAGHFPGDPVYPGALLVEAMGQASLCLHHLLCSGRRDVLEGDHPRDVRLTRIHDARFLSEVRPGETVTLLCRQIADDSFSVTCVAQAIVGERIAAVTAMDVFLVE